MLSEAISNTWKSLPSDIQTWLKQFRCALVFQPSSQCSEMLMKHSSLCLIYITCKTSFTFAIYVYHKPVWQQSYHYKGNGCLKRSTTEVTATKKNKFKSTTNNILCAKRVGKFREIWVCTSEKDNFLCKCVATKLHDK